MTTPDTRPTIAPQVGKRYVRRDDGLTDVECAECDARGPEMARVGCRALHNGAGY